MIVLAAWQTAQQIAGSSERTQHIHTIYHTLRPHPALSPVPDALNHVSVDEQQRNDASYRNVLSQGLISVLLPIEDLQNPCLFALVSEVLGDLVLGEFLAKRMSTGCCVYDCVRKGAEYAQIRSGRQSWLSRASVESKDRLRAHGLLATNEKPQSLNVLSWGYFSAMFWATMQIMYLAFLGARALIKGLASSPQLPRRVYQETSPLIDRSPSTEKSSSPGAVGPSASQKVSRSSHAQYPAMLELKGWQAFSRLLWLDLRIPWLCGVCMSMQNLALGGLGKVGHADGRLDR